MIIPSFLEQLAWLGIRLARHGDRLRVEGPAALLTEELRATLARYKPEVLEVLAGEWSLAASAMFRRLVGVIPEDAWWELGDQFMKRVATCEHQGNLPRSAAERIAYLELAAVADQQVHQHQSQKGVCDEPHHRTTSSPSASIASEPIPPRGGRPTPSSPHAGHQDHVPGVSGLPAQGDRSLPIHGLPFVPTPPLPGGASTPKWGQVA